MGEGHLTFSPIRQTPEVLDLWLRSVEGDVWCYDDNVDPESSALLRDANVEILPAIELPEGGYSRDGRTHEWPMGSISRVAAIKNYAIDLFLKESQPWLFLVDSDVICQPGTINHLTGSEPVISLVYWSQWSPGDPWLPNVWDQGHYGFTQTPARFREPGHYRVGGLGAATLIRRDVLEQVKFEPIPNWPMWGEDRWFCLRCGVLDIDLWACTHVTPFHVYRDEQLPEAVGWDSTKAQAWIDRHLDDRWARSVGA